MFGAVPRICPGGTVACLASGPSLTREDVEAVRGRVDAVIVINTTYQLAPWATALYAADYRWWGWHYGAPDFQGLKFTLPPAPRAWPGVTVLKTMGYTGIETNPEGLRTGGNSGYQAIGVAVHFGASRILLLGYDMQGQGEHWHPPHPAQSRQRFETWRARFQTMVAPLKTLGIEVLNCSRQTALTAFPRVSLEDALARRAA